MALTAQEKQPTEMQQEDNRAEREFCGYTAWTYCQNYSDIWLSVLISKAKCLYLSESVNL